MSIDRRKFLAGSASLAFLVASLRGGHAQGYGQTFKVDNDDGRPIANTRLPGEIVGEIPALKGVTYVGAREAEITLYEFFDYNCPYCRKAAIDMTSLAASDTALRIGLINNPILSPQSAQAAKVALAIQRKMGSAAAWTLYQKLLARPGRIDGTGALQVAATLGVPASELETIADSDEVASRVEGADAHGGRSRSRGDSLLRARQYRPSRTSGCEVPRSNDRGPCVRCDQIAC